MKRLLLTLLALLGLTATHAATLLPAGSLQESVAAANAGDTILVEGPRVFTEQLVLTKPLRLLGTNSPVLDAGGIGTALLIQAENVHVSGFVVRNSGADLSAFDSGIRIEADRVTITNCQVENAAFGIYVRGGSRCILRNNLIKGVIGVSPAARGNGIHLWKTRENEIRNNSISEKRDGIYLSYADKNVIAANSIERSRFGIHYMYSHYNQLLSNSLSANAVGATLMFARHCVVQGNHVSANKRHGLLLKQLESSKVIGNRISGHNRGLFAQQAVQNRFESNIIIRNDIGLYLSGGSEENYFVGNGFVENVDQVWQPPDEHERGRAGSNAFFEDRRGNFWSDYTGVDKNNDAIGDTPYYETDVYGYILQRHPEARVFALSPALSLLRAGERLLPVLDVAGVTDIFPLTRPVFATRPENHSSVVLAK